MSAHAPDPTAILPSAVVSYLNAHRLRDAATAIQAFAPRGASVTDDGKTYAGLRAIRRWLDHSSTEFTYTTDLVGSERLDHDHFVAGKHTEGNFPGGGACLRSRVTTKA